jgi:predicted enzyme related to lactoylglutathione lyase
MLRILTGATSSLVYKLTETSSLAQSLVSASEDGLRPVREDILMPHGKICYLEIPANRAEDSARFYSEIFGWKVRKRGDGNLAFDDTGGVSGTWVEEEDRTPDERTRTYIMVDSITESLKRIERAGGKVVTQRTDIGKDMGTFAAFTDPVGNEFGLYEEPKR